MTVGYQEVLLPLCVWRRVSLPLHQTPAHGGSGDEDDDWFLIIVMNHHHHHHSDNDNLAGHMYDIRRNLSSATFFVIGADGDNDWL